MAQLHPPQVTFIQREAVTADLATRAVTLADESVIIGEVLILATGTTANFFGTPGAEHAIPLYTVDDAERLRDKLATLTADAVPGDERRIAIVGAGPTGIELAGALAELLEQDTEVAIIDRAPVVLSHFTKKTQDYAATKMTEYGVKLHLGRSVTQITSNQLTLDDGTVLDAYSVVWAGGVTPQGPTLTQIRRAPHASRLRSTSSYGCLSSRTCSQSVT